MNVPAGPPGPAERERAVQQDVNLGVESPSAGAKLGSLANGTTLESDDALQHVHLPVNSDAPTERPAQPGLFASGKVVAFDSSHAEQSQDTAAWPSRANTDAEPVARHPVLEGRVGEDDVADHSRLTPERAAEGAREPGRCVSCAAADRRGLGLRRVTNAALKDFKL